MAYRETDVFASDEVVVRAWTNGAAGGIPVLVCNGLGAPAQVWPGLYDDDSSGLRVVGFNHRGTGGSSRPSDESATLLHDYALDAAAVAHHFALDRAIVIGWSVGVAVACELAVREPDLVAGIVAVSGVPSSKQGLRGVIAALTEPAKSLGIQAARALPAPVLDLLNAVPANAATIGMLRTGGLISERAGDERTETALREYLQHDPAWYLQLAQQAMRSDGPAIDDVPCPVTFISGRQDPFVSWQAVSTAAHSIGADTQIVTGTHFLPLERPDVIVLAVRELARRTGVSAAT